MLYIIYHRSYIIHVLCNVYYVWTRPCLSTRWQVRFGVCVRSHPGVHPAGQLQGVVDHLLRGLTDVVEAPDLLVKCLPLEYKIQCTNTQMHT